jgi:Ca2+-binding RTX toxin-like protein
MGLQESHKLRRRGAAALGLAAATLVTGVAAASPAMAATNATVSVSTTSLGPTLSYNGGTDNANQLRIFTEAGEITVTDTAAMTAGTGCRIVAVGKARCGASIATMLVQLGDRNDTADVTVNTGGQVFGDAGDDSLSAGRTGNRGVTYSGGTGFDTVSYSSAPGRVVVTLDGRANDGQPIGSAVGRDNVRDDVERLSGSEFNDQLTGSSRRDAILGLGGIDTIDPGTNVDDVAGGSGNDTFLLRDQFVDVANGGAGTDTATIDRGIDSLSLIETIN